MLIKRKLVLGAVLLTFIPSVVISFLIASIAISSSNSSLQEAAKNQLVSIRDIKKSEIESYFQTIQHQVTTFSNDRMIIDAMKEFKSSFSSFAQQANKENTNELRIELAKYYTNEFGEEYKKLNGNKTAKVSEMLKSLDDDSVAFQYQYIQANKHPLGSKDSLINTDDGSEYSQLHAKYHSHIRDYLQKFEYYDIFLVDSNTGDIVYSVFKELDYTTSLKTGIYANSGIGQAFKGANEATTAEHTTLTDFAPYTPSYNAPASFIASPIFRCYCFRHY